MILKTERLILRPVILEDAQDIFAYASDPEVSKLLRWHPSKSIEETKQIIQQWLTAYQEMEPVPWAIVDKASNKVIGTIGLHTYGQVHRAVIGYCLAQDYWGKGLAPEALNALVDYLFNSTETKVIVAFCRVDNPRSARVLEKCGFKKDAQKKKKEEIKGELVYFDCYTLKK